MALCNTVCAEDVPKFLEAGCQITTRKSGISYLGFIKCDYIFTDILDVAEWTAAVAADQVHITTEGIGSKPETAKTTLKLGACRSEQLVGETHTVPFRTYAVDAVDLTDFDIHSDVRDNIEAFRAFWIGCDGLFYLSPNFATESAGFPTSFTKWDYVQTEDSKDPAMYDIELSFDYTGIVKGKELPGVFAVLN